MNRKCLHDGIHLPQYISPPNNTCSEVCLILFQIITQNYIVALSLGTPVCLSIGFYWINPSYVAKRSLKRQNMLPSYRLSVSSFGSNTSSMVMSDHLWLPSSWTGCECVTDGQSECLSSRFPVRSGFDPGTSRSCGIMTNDLQRLNAAHLEVISQAPDRDKHMEKQKGTSYWRHVVKSAVICRFSSCYIRVLIHY